MAQFKDENFICAKEVDRSLLRQGFTLPVKMLWEFKSWFCPLQVGESRDVAIRLNGKEFRVQLGNRNFDRSKWLDRLSYAKSLVNGVDEMPLDRHVN